MRNPDPSPEYLAAFHEAAYRLAGKRPQVGEDEPAWNVDLFEVERQARAACPAEPGDELNWKPNIDRPIETAPRDELILGWANGMTEWQPIETAPRDELILGWADGMMRLVLWQNGWAQVGATIEKGWFEPTHWISLPAGPVQ